jgi:hypothetical protein
MGKDKLFCHCTPVLDTMNENWMKGHLFMNKKIIKKFITAILIMFIAFMVPASSYAYLGDRTLTIGMQGYDVNQLQRDLNYLGYSAGWADSIFGQQTLAAVKGFQKDHGSAIGGKKEFGKINTGLIYRPYYLCASRSFNCYLELSGCFRQLLVQGFIKLHQVIKLDG